MNVRKASVAAALALSLPAAPADAQAFNGPYAGVQAGWERTRARDAATDLVNPGRTNRNDAPTGGMFIGYDRPIAPSVLVGAEAGMDFSSDDAVSGASTAGRFSIDPRWSLDLTARAGLLIDPRTLVYGRGGYETAWIDTNALIRGSRFASSETREGWTLGAGIERRFVQNISGRLEYRYSELSDGDGIYDRHRILAGIAFHF